MGLWKVLWKDYSFLGVVPWSLAEICHVWQEHGVSLYRAQGTFVTLVTLRHRQHIPLEYWHLLTKLYSNTTQRTIVLILTTMKTLFPEWIRDLKYFRFVRVLCHIKLHRDFTQFCSLLSITLAHSCLWCADF